MEELKAFANTLNLQWFGIVTLESSKAFARYSEWIAAGRHAHMDYLARNAEIRQDPTRLLPEAQAAIIVGLNYYQGDTYAKVKSEGLKIAQYARLADYHKTLKKAAESFAQYIAKTHQCETRVLVDTAPVLEKALAAKTTNGFIGKNTLFIDRYKGSYFLLAEILTTHKFNPDPKAISEPATRQEGGCGTCKRCQTYCPTGALSSDYQIDAGKCLAYYNIEHRGIIPVEYWKYFATYFFGCDICQLVCPYNRAAQRIPESAVRVGSVDLLEVLFMDQRYYEATFGGTPLTRAKKSGLQRNALIAMVVTNHPKLKEALAQLPDDPLLQQTAAQISEWFALTR